MLHICDCLPLLSQAFVHNSIIFLIRSQSHLTLPSSPFYLTDYLSNVHNTILDQTRSPKSNPSKGKTNPCIYSPYILCDSSKPMGTTEWNGTFIKMWQLFDHPLSLIVNGLSAIHHPKPDFNNLID